MNRPPIDPDAYRPNMCLARLYDSAEEHGDDALESLCPYFLQLEEEGARYVDETLLGRGGLKEVYRAFDRRTRRWVALARLREDRSLQYYDLFVHEAWLVASLSHPNIIKVHDAGVDDLRRPFFVMDLKGDLTLMDLIRDPGAQTRNDLLEAFLKVCDAMAYAHSRSTLHLDLKPDNIQCNRFGEVRVCDWGLGRILKGDAFPVDTELLAMPSVEENTLLGQVKGSLGYMAPEQIQPDMELNERTDIYALGCMLHTLLCGEPPFTGTMDDVLEQTRKSEVAALTARYPDRLIPTSLEAVVLKATARNPSERYDSVEEFRREIHKYLTGYSTEAERSGFLKEAWLFLGRNRKAASVAAAALVTLSVFALVHVKQLGEQQLVTQEQRVRADKLLSEVTELSADYEHLFHESAVTKVEWARQLADAAAGVRNMGIILRPVQAVDKSFDFVELALEFDPGCGRAQWERFGLHCLMLNFEAALRVSLPDPNEYRQRFVNLAQTFPDYAFTKEIRPTTEQIIAFYDEVPESGHRTDSMLENIFAYHVATTDINPADRSRELGALLACLNDGREHFSMEYDVQTALLKVQSDGKRLIFKTPSGRKGGLSLLRFLPIRSFKFSGPSSFGLKELNRLPVEVLDLSEAADVNLYGGVSLPSLRIVRVRSGQFNEAQLRNRVKTIEPFEIIEVDVND